MKKLLLTLMLGVFAFAAHSQSWYHVTAPRGSYSFDTPTAPGYHFDQRYTSLHQWIKSDSSIVIESHYADSANLDPGAGDPYLMFAQTLVYNTNGTLESNQSISVPVGGKAGKEIGVSYINQKSNLQFLFVRVFFINNKIYSFSITAEEDDLSDLLSYKTIYFGSISIN